MIRLATVGTSAITVEFLSTLARVNATTPLFEHALAFSRDPQRARRFADRTGAGAASTDLDDLSRVDAVYVATPNSSHHDIVATALAMGRHVLVEKPAVVTAAGWDELVATAEETGCALLEANRHARWDPGSRRVAELLDELGPIRLSDLHMHQRSSRLDDFRAGHVASSFDPDRAGGSLMDIGTYPLETMIELFGVPNSVHAAAAILDNGIDGAGTLTAEYPGHLSTVSWSKLSDGGLASQVQGEEGWLTIDSVADPRHLTVSVRGKRTDIEVDKPGPGNLDHEIRAFAEAVEDPSSCRQYQWWTGQRLRVMEQVRDQLGLELPGR